MGRAGRVSSSGTRARTLLYILYNSQVLPGLNLLNHAIQDLGKNVTDMSEVVRTLCKSSDTCLKTILKKSFVGQSGYLEIAKMWPRVDITSFILV